MMNSLFDKSRKKEIKDGLAKGNLELSRHKPIVENDDNVTREAVASKADKAVPAPPSMQPPPIMKKKEPPIDPKDIPPINLANPLIERPCGRVPSMHRDNWNLMDAIRCGDYAKAKDEIENGALVNQKWPDFESLNAQTTSLPGQRVIIPAITPLELARRLGRPDFEELLKKHGATE